MIRYSLACETDHRFESWFRDSDAFDDQARRGLVECPICHSTEVVKAIMAPAVVGGRTDRRGATPNDADVARTETPASGDESGRGMRAMVRAFRAKVLSEGTDVGARFPDEARRIHDGEAPARTIYGQASPDETRGLLDDGIVVFPLPPLPDGLN
jgi:hypothetical protein